VRALVTSQLYADLYGNGYPQQPVACREGDWYYLDEYPDAAEAVASGAVASAWEHYQQHQQDRLYPCFYELHHSAAGD